MPRRKTKAPSTDAAAQDAPAAPTPAPAAQAGAQDEALRTTPPEPASPAPIPDVVVCYGDIEEDPVAWQVLRDELAAYYGAEGPVELAQVERITDLRWRLDRFTRAERGMVANATIGVKWRRTMGRVTGARDELAWAKVQSRGVIGAERSNTLRLARNDLAEVIEQWDCGEQPDTVAIFKPLQVIFGCDKDGMPHGRGQSLAFTWDLVGMARLDAESVAAGEPSPHDDDDDRPASHVEDFEAVMRKQLGDALEMVDGLIESLELDERARDLATVEAHGIPAAESLRGLGQYEQHLSELLERATAELQRTIARRRLAGLARRARLV